MIFLVIQIGQREKIVILLVHHIFGVHLLILLGRHGIGEDGRIVIGFAQFFA